MNIERMRPILMKAGQIKIGECFSYLGGIYLVVDLPVDLKVVNSEGEKWIEESVLAVNFSTGYIEPFDPEETVIAVTTKIVVEEVDPFDDAVHVPPPPKKNKEISKKKVKQKQKPVE